ncbi:MAG: hypothetical protein IH991_08440 [Planctomycetes bacterium]|nr:hypothetical protein [Planctomycetota bacterium]
MIDNQALANAFNPNRVPEALRDLLALENSVDGWLSEGFEFYIDEDNVGLKTYSEAVDFLNHFVEFAQADGTGSTYAIWLNESSNSVDECPVVIFGSEGGVHVVARNLAEWFQILSYDVEPMVDHDSVYYYKDTDDYAPSDRIDEYRNWLVTRQRLKPIEDADSVVEIAKEHHQEALTSFIRQYVDGF